MSRKKNPTQKPASVEDMDAWAADANATHAARERVLRDPRLADLLFADAAKERRRPIPPGRPPSQYSDDDLLRLEAECRRTFQRALYAREPRQREVYDYVSRALKGPGLTRDSVRDRLCAIHRKRKKEAENAERLAVVQRP